MSPAAPVTVAESVRGEESDEARSVIVYAHAGRWRIVVGGVTIFAVGEETALQLADHIAELEHVAVVATAPQSRRDPGCGI